MSKLISINNRLINYYYFLAGFWTKAASERYDNQKTSSSPLLSCYHPANSLASSKIYPLLFVVQKIQSVRTVFFKLLNVATPTNLISNYVLLIEYLSKLNTYLLTYKNSRKVVFILIKFSFDFFNSLHLLYNRKSSNTYMFNMSENKNINKLRIKQFYIMYKFVRAFRALKTCPILGLIFVYRHTCNVTNCSSSCKLMTNIAIKLYLRVIE